ALVGFFADFLGGPSTGERGIFGEKADAFVREDWFSKQALVPSLDVCEHALGGFVRVSMADAHAVGMSQEDRRAGEIAFHPSPETFEIAHHGIRCRPLKALIRAQSSEGTILLRVH